MSNERGLLYDWHMFQSLCGSETRDSASNFSICVYLKYCTVFSDGLEPCGSQGKYVIIFHQLNETLLQEQEGRGQNQSKIRRRWRLCTLAQSSRPMQRYWHRHKVGWRAQQCVCLTLWIHYLAKLHVGIWVSRCWLLIQRIWDSIACTKRPLKQSQLNEIITKFHMCCGIFSYNLMSVQVGGLGDVVAGLSRACLERGHDVEVILPCYECLPTERVGELKHVLDFEVPTVRPSLQSFSYRPSARQMSISSGFTDHSLA